MDGSSSQGSSKVHAGEAAAPASPRVSGVSISVTGEGRGLSGTAREREGIARARPCLLCSLACWLSLQQVAPPLQCALASMGCMESGGPAVSQGMGSIKGGGYMPKAARTLNCFPVQQAHAAVG